MAPLLPISSFYFSTVTENRTSTHRKTVKAAYFNLLPCEKDEKALLGSSVLCLSTKEQAWWKDGDGGSCQKVSPDCERYNVWGQGLTVNSSLIFTSASKIFTVRVSCPCCSFSSQRGSSIWWKSGGQGMPSPTPYTVCAPPRNCLSSPCGVSPSFCANVKQCLVLQGMRPRRRSWHLLCPVGMVTTREPGCRCT